MNIDIRASVKSSLNGMNESSLETTILDAIKKQDDVTLPGLGVLFESLWSTSSKDEQNYILNKLAKTL